MKTNTNLTEAARWFHALSDATRLQVVELLGRGEMCVCDLQDAVGAAQSRLSFHLRVLREAGLVNDRRAGRWVFYSLRPEALDELAAWVQDRKPAADAWGTCACGSGETDCCA
jgi:ArsR family transcriptional regulator, arsenate/arsenite/antimonite-responsive transcriptional repressor